MKGMTKTQLEIAIENNYDNHPDEFISEDDIRDLFDVLGDDYEPSMDIPSAWKLVNESPGWEGARGVVPGIPKKGDHLL